MGGRKRLRYDVRLSADVVASAADVTVAVAVAASYRAAVHATVPLGVFAPVVEVFDHETGAIL